MLRFDDTLFKSACAKLAESFTAENQPLSTARAPEFLAAGLGFWTAKLLREYKTPLTLRFREGDPKKPGVDYLSLVADRLERNLKLDYWDAQRFAPRVIAVIEQFGLAVDVARCLFEPELEDSCAKILAAMDDKNVRQPERASAAISRNLIPRPPRASLHDRLRELEPQLSTLVDKCTDMYLWQSACTTDREFAEASADEYSYRGYEHHARLGLGFSIITRGEGWRKGDVYRIVNPVLYFCGDRQWRVRTNAIECNSIYQRSLDELESIIGGKLAELPKLEVCKECHAVHLPQATSPHSCHSSVSFPILKKALDKVHKQNWEYVTTAELLAAYISEGAPAPEHPEFVRTLLRFKRTFQIRDCNGYWRFPEKFGEPPRQRLILNHGDDRDQLLIALSPAPFIYTPGQKNRFI